MSSDAWVTDPFAVGAVITVLIAVSFWLDRHFRFFSFLGTAILVITGAAILVNLQVIPPSIGQAEGELNPIYVFAGDYGIPLAIVLLLLSTDLTSLRRLGKPAIIAFILGALGTVIGAMVAIGVTATGIGDEAWKVGGQFTASYIGGGVNYAAVGDALGTSETMFATGAAADNIMTNLWMVMTALLPVVLRSFYPSIRDRRGEIAPPMGTGLTGKAIFTIHGLVTLAAVTFVIVAIGEWLTPVINQAVGVEIPSVLWYTTLALLVAWLTPINRLAGGEEMGNFILHFFFATMGAGTILHTLVEKGPIVFLFLAILVSIHAFVLFGAGRWFKVEVEVLATASQACIGGPSTAVALASSKGWYSLVTPAVLLGVLGYVVGNYLGVVMGQLMQWILGGTI
ncbi:DUF819 domain-containing protein [Desmospora activa]|uniref:Putative membrane protein n=1 Tax=Desmospora activa DSM 45169 TaxID=1121389 RepID=A0A2T4ZAT6_9BACL|nr:DUF819 family protein [Desmospora activa]PTM59004.1 putative membrane protein [Desmospora activa DSM 45169]